MTGNKALWLILIFCYAPIILMAQEKIKFNCESIDFKLKDNLHIVIDNYINFLDHKGELILVDYMSNDSIDIFRLGGSICSFELLYKKPDCFFYYRDNIVYLYTENYTNNKDTIWLNNVLLETLKLSGRSGTTIIDWSKDSIIALPSNYIKGYETYNPWIIEYKIYKGKIIEEKNCNEMLYPYTGKPKGIPIFR